METTKERTSRKRRKKDKQKRQGAAASGAAVSAREPAAEVALEIEEGIEIRAFAAAKAMPLSEVWRRIRTGVYAARTRNGQTVVYERCPPKPAPAASGGPGAQRASGREALELPSLRSPNNSDGERKYLSLEGGYGDSPEVALLLDHLSLAKEENREILRLTEESVRRITQMTEKVVAVKDELLAEKATRLEEKQGELQERERTIHLLESRLTSQESEMRRLRKNIEDLEILTRSLSED